jgi:outer membrane protein assembly factor BamD (BamD/ComL family)
LYAGHLSLELNLVPQAVSDYEQFLKGSSGELQPLALIGLAYAQKKNNDKAKALEAFESILKNNWNISTDVVLWESAQLARELKQPDLAKKRAEELLLQYPDSPMADGAQDIIAELSKAKS